MTLNGTVIGNIQRETGEASDPSQPSAFVSQMNTVESSIQSPECEADAILQDDFAVDDGDDDW